VIVYDSDPFARPYFPLSDRLRRLAWNLAWLIMFRPSPRPFHAWRVWLLRAFGAKIGRDVRIYPAARVWAPWKLTIADQATVGDGAILYNMGGIVLGERCAVSQGAHLCGGSHDIDSKNMALIAAPIVIEANAWVCAEAFIGLGVRIAQGCVIGARAVMMKSAPEAWTVWVGNPAAPIRKRMRPE
jgi:putative colanic acid biosynthesis acetyltransferase WcaF